MHFQHNDRYAKRELATPLRDVKTLLPSHFVQVHRSHIVNLKHIVTVRRKHRSIRLILDSGYEETPCNSCRLRHAAPTQDSTV